MQIEQRELHLPQQPPDANAPNMQSSTWLVRASVQSPLTRFDKAMQMIKPLRADFCRASGSAQTSLQKL